MGYIALMSHDEECSHAFPTPNSKLGSGTQNQPLRLLAIGIGWSSPTLKLFAPPHSSVLSRGKEDECGLGVATLKVQTQETLSFKFYSD